MTLLVLGLFGLLLVHANALSNLVRQNIEIQVHLNQSVDEASRKEFLEEISRKPYVAKEEGEPIILYISKEEAAKEFITETGENFQEILSINPLRDVFRVKLKPEYASDKNLALLKTELESYDAVYEADYDPNLVSLINRNLAKVSLILIGFSLILFVTVIILINNTIKLAMFSQRFLIRSMNLVGATEWFIMKPFLERAALVGLLCGAMADILLFFLLTYANSQIAELASLQDPFSLVVVFVLLLVVGMAMSVGSSWVSVRRYLRMKLDDLY